MGSGRSPGADAAAAKRAAERARILACYWDDSQSEYSNLELIGWWLEQAQRRGRNAGDAAELADF